LRKAFAAGGGGGGGATQVKFEIFCLGLGRARVTQTFGLLLPAPPSLRHLQNSKIFQM